MRLILFGAGASHGSDTHGTPPLGPNLFTALVQWSPATWGALAAPWPSRFQTDFEDAMAKLIAAGIFAAPLQWSMASYFFKCFTASDSNVYIRLLRDILASEKDVNLATLNYELLLVQAAQRVGMRLNCGSSKRSGSELPLCLPHGSSMLKCVGITATGSISFSGGISTGGTVSTMSNVQEFDQERNTNVFPPVMSYFEPNKFTVSCANFIDANRRRFAQLATDASRLAIVGVNVHPIDRHIWDPISKTSATCFYLGGSAGGQKYSTWCSQVGRNSDTVCDRFFADGYDDLLSFLTG